MRKSKKEKPKDEAQNVSISGPPSDDKKWYLLPSGFFQTYEKPLHAYKKPINTYANQQEACEHLCKPRETEQKATRKLPERYQNGSRTMFYGFVHSEMETP